MNTEYEIFIKVKPSDEEDWKIIETKIGDERANFWVQEDNTRNNLLNHMRKISLPEQVKEYYEVKGWYDAYDVNEDLSEVFEVSYSYILYLIAAGCHQPWDELKKVIEVITNMGGYDYLHPDKIQIIAVVWQ